jgi:hypothetical protein
MSRPDSIAVDHGKIYASEHLASMCQRMGISMEPAGTQGGRDKGPLERFVRTTCEGLQQYLPSLAINAGDLGTVTYVVDPRSKAIYPRCSVTDRFSGQERHGESR